MEALIHAFVRDEGSVVLLGATLVEDGREVTIAVDHRPAQDIVRALDYEEPLVEIESWMIVGS